MPVAVPGFSSRGRRGRNVINVKETKRKDGKGCGERMERIKKNQRVEQQKERLGKEKSGKDVDEATSRTASEAINQRTLKVSTVSRKPDATCSADLHQHCKTPSKKTIDQQVKINMAPRFHKHNQPIQYFDFV